MTSEVPEPESISRARVARQVGSNFRQEARKRTDFPWAKMRDEVRSGSADPGSEELLQRGMGKEVWSLKVRERFGIAFIACWSLVLGGCFENDYQRRLDTANDYFRHQEFLDGNLGPTWYGTGLSFSVTEAIRIPCTSRACGSRGWGGRGRGSQRRGGTGEASGRLNRPTSAGLSGTGTCGIEWGPGERVRRWTARLPRRMRI